LVEFDVENHSSCIKIYIRTVKDGTIFCENPSYIFLENMYDIQLKIYERIYSNEYLSTSYEIIKKPLYVWFVYYPKKTCVCSKYTVKLHEDDLLNDIKIKKTYIKSCSIMCFSNYNK